MPINVKYSQAILNLYVSNVTIYKTVTVYFILPVFSQENCSS